ncbi:hypothetical protein FQZ97_1083610 [compost metagenome]
MQRGVPRQDDPNHAKGISACIDVIVGALVNHVPVHDVDDATIKLKVLGGQVHQRRHLAAGFTGIGLFQRAQRIFALTDDAPEFIEDAPTFGGAHVAPALQRGGCRLDCQSHILRPAAGDFTDLGSGARIDLVDILPVSRLHGTAIDEAVNFYKHCVSPLKLQ